ncbi:3'(2'),5'-bisphosphate nucleotidase [Pseudomonas saudimassiliensis]|uniref:3'(2'),5'-bisphosphate nucleotidase CysQ n=1 Tax=Pseudomonas saudimassiliensis TaxID=1461581 RepID=A0A078MCX7_9PSED|nr:3'(2'),5'-bisphosphate nucleotidase CysQ [Pseudomonas saudimassiliensis]CEA03267.1 3'(2'),5'-bisphosphate nucleotidase [Pseudomonas saudimassiliensis]CEF26133.1 3'(2'),5'-bisphosphate nucleotidase [Pseudomonas saudimassiliensis]
MSLPVAVERLCQLTRDAGHAALPWWQHNPEVITKADDSPVTAADLAANQVIVDGLRALAPEIPVLSEEDADVPFDERQHWARFWLVDPLDGTKEFIAGSDEFTVNIALIEHGEVRFGIVGVPAQDTLYWGGAGLGSWRQQGDEPAQPIHCRAPATPLRIVASRRHTSADQEALLDRLQQAHNTELLGVGSSLKFCVLAAGEADLYPRFAPTSQWDTAAAQAVLEGAGGRVLDLNGERFSYPHRADWLNPHFIATGQPDDALLRLLLG